MGVRAGQWVLGAGVAVVFSLQPRGIRSVHARLVQRDHAEHVAIFAGGLSSSHARPAPHRVPELLPRARGTEAPPKIELALQSSVPAPVEPPSAPEPEEVRPVRQVPACTAELGLVGAVVNEQNPRLSRAVMRTAGGAAVVAVGARIDAFVVHAVLPSAALLRDATGDLCALRGFSAGPIGAPRSQEPAPPRPEDKKEAAPRGKPVFSPEELADGLTMIGEGDYRVKRTFLLKALTNPGGSAGGAWFRPSHNEADGGDMEVLGIRTGTALDAMGIKNKDVLHSLNGIELNGASGLISALRTAREADQVVIQVMRDGVRQDLRYRVE